MRAQAVFGRELAGDADADALWAGFDDARRDDARSAPAAPDQRLCWSMPERRDLLRRELQIDHLVLRADQVDLADIRHGQDLGADVFDIIPHLPLRQAVGGEGIDVAEDVAEAVVEDGTLLRPPASRP